jgi:protein-S-isoprenylcysteine O-methyltransferase Ste14
MELAPSLEIGWLNGWLPLALLCLVEGVLLKTSPKEVVAKLFDRSTWDQKQRTLTAIGKLFSLACLILIIFTPLRIGSSVFLLGVVLYAVGLVGLVIAILDFKNTPLDQPVSARLYSISRHPQIVMIFVLFLGMCLAIGSWPALFTLMMSRLFQHFGILAEEEACLARYGESYRTYMERVPRYFVFF